MKFTIYCDGSARNNGRPNAVGAWAYVILVDDNETIIHQDCKAVEGATNQQMELTAAIEAIEYLFHNHIAVPFDSVTVYTDSAYLHNCYTQKWYSTWQMNNWKNTKKQPVANKELWERLVRWFESAEVEFIKTKGHAGVKWNEYVDTMAQTASLEAKENK
jgi:ribonuclease HI